MRILFSLLDAGLGGGQSVALSIAERLVANGHRVGVIVPSDGPASQRFRAMEAAVHTADIHTLRNAVQVEKVARALRGYEALYSHTSVPGEILGDVAARWTNRPHVIHRHTPPDLSPSGPIRATQRVLYRTLLRNRAFIAVAPHVRRQVIALGARPSRVTVVTNGVNAEAVRARMLDTALPSERLRVGLLGRLDPQKGADVFVRAARLRRSHAGVDFVLGVAAGPFRAHEELVRGEAALAGVPIEEPGAAGVEFLAGLDIVAMPSRWEGSPLTLFEAMALGKAVVASDIPGIAEVLAPSGAGVLVPVEDPGALAHAIDELLGNEQRRRALGVAALTLVRDRYTLDGMIEASIAVLGDVVREMSGDQPGAASGRHPG
jgi:glycosyltransferase involved in cell wall biosynthesis